MSHIPPPHSAQRPDHSPTPSVPPAPTSVPADRRALLAGIGGLAAGALLAGAKTANAGPLNPPAGPIASTGKTLTEVEPRIAINSTNTPGSSATSSIFRITQPGSYYLTANLIPTVTNRHVISIAADGVTIDLNGFLIRGLGNLQGAFDAIFAETGAQRITIKNGHVELAGRNGIDLTNAPGCIVQDVTVGGCFLAGIDTGGSTRVERCNAIDNTGEGIRLGECCVAKDCAISGSTAGIRGGSNCLVENCVVRDSNSTGISANSGSVVLRCTVRNAGASGIRVNDAVVVEACVATGNAAVGIGAFADGAIGVRIANCSVFENQGSGIEIASASLCLGNAVANNVGSGINVVGADNRIEDNNASGNAIGIDVDSPGNIILRNTCSGNTTVNYDFVANNRYGPIINLSAAGTAPVNGNSAADTSGTTHPWANFAY